MFQMLEDANLNNDFINGVKNRNISTILILLYNGLCSKLISFCQSLPLCIHETCHKHYGTTSVDGAIIRLAYYDALHVGILATRKAFHRIVLDKIHGNARDRF